MNHVRDAVFHLFNECWISLVRGGFWIGFSHEIEYDDGTETRKYGWKVRNSGTFRELYLRVWIGKTVFVWTKSGLMTKQKDKWGIKLILGFEFLHA